jgi:GTP-binding protein
VRLTSPYVMMFSLFRLAKSSRTCVPRESQLSPTEDQRTKSLAMKISSVEFAGAAAQPGAYPKLPYPEIAFAGRSNVGKSSLINRLLDRQVAHISATPGRTRQLNFFVVNNKLTFVDLPGYGYAQVAKQEREQWQKLIEGYLIDSRNLRGVVIIVDIRRGPEEEEETLCDFLSYHQRPFLIVATKCDKLKRAQLEQQRKALTAQMDGYAPLLFSAQTGSGKEELWREILVLISRCPGYA